MTRLTAINDLLFPVEERPVFTLIETRAGEREISVPNKKALVDMKANRVVGVVSSNYRLVTNQQALDWARQCCVAVFPETKAAEWIVDGCDAPRSRGHCFMDLKHNSAVLDFSLAAAEHRPDAFGPFIRVTNSYNSLRALTFDIGFYRKVCKNGLISPRSIIQFKFIHTNRDIGKHIRFDVNQKKLAEFKNDFYKYMEAFRKCAVPYDKFRPLLQGVLRVHPPQNVEKNSRIADSWESLCSYMDGLCEKYVNELGENAYAVFNAITDFASHPPANRCVYRERHSFQKLAGAWVSAFHGASSAKDFNLDDYSVSLTQRRGKAMFRKRR